MDDDDAKYYNEQIRHFEENSNDMTNLLKQQIYVKSSLGAINNTLTGMEYNEEKVKKGLFQIRNYILSVTADNRNTLSFLSAKITVENHIVRANEAANML
jgi:hypothetical protein